MSIPFNIFFASLCSVCDSHENGSIDAHFDFIL